MPFNDRSCSRELLRRGSQVATHKNSFRDFHLDDWSHFKLAGCPTHRAEKLNVLEQTGINGPLLDIDMELNQLDKKAGA